MITQQCLTTKHFRVKTRWSFPSCLEFSQSVGPSSSVAFGALVWPLALLAWHSEDHWICLSFMMRTPTQSTRTLGPRSSPGGGRGYFCYWQYNSLHFLGHSSECSNLWLQHSQCVDLYSLTLTGLKLWPKQSRIMKFISGLPWQTLSTVQGCAWAGSPAPSSPLCSCPPSWLSSPWLAASCPPPFWCSWPPSTTSAYILGYLSVGSSYPGNLPLPSPGLLITWISLANCPPYFL